MQAYWEQIEALFRARVKRCESYFGPGATPVAVRRLEKHLGLALPDDFKDFYAVHNGQGRGPYGLIFGLELLSLSRIRREWDTWRSIGDEINDELAYAMRSQPDGYIRKLYLNPRWIPFTSDQSGNHIGLDLDPDALGVPGQVIIFGRDENTKKLLARSFRDYIHIFVEQLATIEWSIDPHDGWEIAHKTYGRRHYHEWLEPAMRAGYELVYVS